MRGRYALALDRVDAQRRGVEQDVHQVVGQKVHLVDVQDAAVRRRQQPRLEGAPPLAQGALEVECAEDAVLGRPERQVDERHRRLGGAALGAGGAVRAVRPGGVGVAAERAALDRAQRRQQGAQGAGGGALGRPLLAADQHAAEARVDGAQQQRRLERILTDQGAERVFHGSLPPLAFRARRAPPASPRSATAPAAAPPAPPRSARPTCRAAPPPAVARPPRAGPTGCCARRTPASPGRAHTTAPPARTSSPRRRPRWRRSRTGNRPSPPAPGRPCSRAA